MSDSAISCPGSHRRTDRPGEAHHPAIEEASGRWLIRSQELARQILRDHGDVCHQDGFSSRMMRRGATGMRMPVLYLEGEEHRAARRQIARYFTPQRVSTEYRELMEARADELIAWARRQRAFSVDMLSLRMAVHVTAGVLGLTESATDPMARRLGRFFDLPTPNPKTAEDGVGNRMRRRARRLAAIGPLIAFYLRDVRPAVRARRKNPANDVISQLIAEGGGRADFLTECLTYAAAGMVTTREFIVVAAWHLLDDEPLRQRYLAAEEAERHAILQEILRLEPVVGHIRRRTTAPITLRENGHEWRLPAGARLDMFVRSVNADPSAVGEQPHQLCPDRQRAAGVRPEVLAFGDGAHRCPGNSLAIQESDVLLRRLLQLPVWMINEPRLEWTETVSGYQLRGMRLRITG